MLVIDFRSDPSPTSTTITLRLTGYDQQRQFERVTNEVVARLR
jgi:hypothetical protein